MSNARDLVVIVMDGALSAWQAPRFGIPFFQSQGIDVVCFDARVLRGTGAAEAGDVAGVAYIADVKSLAVRFGHAGHVFVFSYFDLGEAIFSELTDELGARGIGWCQVRTGEIPAALPPRGLREAFAFRAFQFRRALRMFGLLRVLKARCVQIFERRRGNPMLSPRYVLLEGLKSARTSDAGAISIAGHSRDMEMVIIEGVVAAHPPENICVFMDQNEPQHTDWALQGISYRDLPEERWYLEALLECFEVIEAATGLKVVVLPHPRFTYPQGYFGRFPVQSGDTMLAVAKARLVVSHYSTALAFPVIFDKPVLLLNAEVFRERMGGRSERQILAFAEALGATVLSMDAPAPEVLRGWERIDRKKYDTYRTNYIEHPDSSRESMWKTALDIMGKDRKFHRGSGD